MYTAKDVYNFIESEKGFLGEELDIFIKDKVQFLFLYCNPVQVSETFVPESLRKNRDTLLEMFRLRGFDAKFECEDRPCGSCYYVIGIPPQGE